MKNTGKLFWGAVMILSSLLVFSTYVTAPAVPVPACDWTHAETGWYCFNAVDDNCNTLTDAADTFWCSCMDTKDNNGGGGIDCADSACGSEPYCGRENTVVYCDGNGQNCKNGCSDGFDNNGNGLIDCADPDCSDFGACATTTTTTSSTTTTTTSSTTTTTSSSSSSSSSSTSSSTSSSSSSSSSSTTLGPTPCESILNSEQCSSGVCPEGLVCVGEQSDVTPVSAAVGQCVCDTTTTTSTSSTTTTTTSTTTTLAGGGGPTGGPGGNVLGPSSGVLPTCFDGLKNRDEEKVDCGGVFCNPCISPTTTLPAYPTTTPTTTLKVTVTTLENIVPVEAVSAVTTTTLSGLPTGAFILPLEEVMQAINWNLCLFLLMCLMGVYFYRIIEPPKNSNRLKGSK